MAGGLLQYSDSRWKQSGLPARSWPRQIRLCGLSLLLIMLSAYPGCGDSFVGLKSVPTPLPETFPYEIQGASAGSFWGGDSFEATYEGLLHYLVLQGIDSPKRGQDYYRQSRKCLMDLVRNRPLRAVLYGLDDEKREIAQVFVGDVDVNLEMVRAGAAWFDGNEFEDSDRFKAAEQEAREKKIGLWKNPNAVPPSEFDEIDPRK